MRPKRRLSKSHSRSERLGKFEELEKTPTRLKGRRCPENVEEEKERFLREGITPLLKISPSSKPRKSTYKKRSKVSYDLLGEAQQIIDDVINTYGNEKNYWDIAFGEQIDSTEANEILVDYMAENRVMGQIDVYWAADLTASAKMMWRGPNMRYQKPEERKYTMVIKSKDNAYLRKLGIRCLADHEIGTHYFRMVNDGLQPWYAERQKFGLRSTKSRERNCTEEGLAGLNTVINAKLKYLFNSALAYYIACKSMHMTFTELFEHLEKYVTDRDLRWKYVMRVKRGLKDPGTPGGFGWDQCYFEGAVEILRNLDDIDFSVLYSGCICVDEVKRIKRLARTECIRTPKFLRNVELYKKKLRKIGYVNKILRKSSKGPEVVPKVHHLGAVIPATNMDSSKKAGGQEEQESDSSDEEYDTTQDRCKETHMSAAYRKEQSELKNWSSYESLASEGTCLDLDSEPSNSESEDTSAENCDKSA